MYPIYAIVTDNICAIALFIRGYISIELTLFSVYKTNKQLYTIPVRAYVLLFVNYKIVISQCQEYIKLLNNTTTFVNNQNRYMEAF
jgi:hypothetical protein